MTVEKIVLEKREEVATITFNRPEKGNAVDLEMMEDLNQKLLDVAANGSFRVLVLQGRGDHFCVGRDPGRTRPQNAAEWAEVLTQIIRVNQQLSTFPGISLALVQGRAFGFGCGLAVQSDVTVAADNARFAFPEIKAGLPPTIVMSYLGRWIPRKKAFELVITGSEMDAREAERLGIVSRIVPSDQLADEGKRWISLFLNQDADALRTCKRFFLDTADLTSEDASRYGAALLANLMSSRSKG
ncbi:MAG: enoyl-CoA hydratase/isomerase family protein [Candidatus Binatia bacterium]